MADRVVASIEARMASTRLPGKVMADIAGEVTLTRILRRLRLCECLDDIVLATTTSQEDDVLAEWAASQAVVCHRGSENDVLTRVAEAHAAMESDIIVEICGDTPLLDPFIIDLAVATFQANDCAVVSTTRVPSFPQGVDVEVFALSDLQEASQQSQDPAIREHVSLYFYEHPDRYRIINLAAPVSWQRPGQRLQLDYAEDQFLISEIYRRLEPDFGDRFGVTEILSVLDADPTLASSNSHCLEQPVR